MFSFLFDNNPLPIERPSSLFKDDDDFGVNSVRVVLQQVLRKYIIPLCKYVNGSQIRSFHYVSVARLRRFLDVTEVEKGEGFGKLKIKSGLGIE